MLKTLAEFREWLERAKPRSQFTYHKGHLCRDRLLNDGKWPGVKVIAPSEIMGTMAWKSYQEKRVHLMQRRVDKNTFDYIAVMR